MQCYFIKRQFDIYYSISVGYLFENLDESHIGHTSCRSRPAAARTKYRAHPMTSDVSNVRPLERVACEEIVIWSLGFTGRRYHPANMLIRLGEATRSQRILPPPTLTLRTYLFSENRKRSETPRLVLLFPTRRDVLRARGLIIPRAKSRCSTC